MADTNDTNFDHAQYAKDSAYSKGNPLPRRLIVGDRVEVFALPGFEKQPGRYVLSLTSTAEAVEKISRSIFAFARSNAFKAFWGNAFTFSPFNVELSDKPINGVPLVIATQYWMKEAFAGNLAAQEIVSSLMQSKLEDLCDVAFEVERSGSERTARFLDLLQSAPGDWWVHFQPEYYAELYRVLPICVKTGKTHPALFGQITRSYFYALFPDGVVSFFDDNNPNREFRHHQLLTEEGNARFKEAMISFLTFLKGMKPGSFKEFRQHYQNTYGFFVQSEFDFDEAA